MGLFDSILGNASGLASSFTGGGFNTSVLPRAASAATTPSGNKENINGKLDLSSIFAGGSNTEKRDTNVVDKDWLNQRFIAPDGKLPSHIAKNRFYTNASRKSTDTTLGGNLAVNARPQYTPYADPSLQMDYGILDNVSDIGMSRLYSEYIDDYQQYAFLTFGLPRFNSLLDYFTRAVDYEDSVLANTGRTPTGYTAGKWAGDIIMLAALPLITLTVWAAKTITKALIGDNAFNFYYLETNMSMYWGMVNNIVTALSVELRILIPQLMPSDDIKQRIGLPVQFDSSDMEALAAMLPGIINPNTNYIDVFRIATKTQGIANIKAIKEKEKYDAKAVADYDYEGYVKAQNTKANTNIPGSGILNGVNYTLTFQKYLDNIKESKLFADTKESGADISQNASAPVTSASENGNVSDLRMKKGNKGEYAIDLSNQDGYLSSFVKAFDSSLRDGALYAIFAVDYVGPVSESFSNSTSQISTGSTINQIGGASRDMRFNMAGGNIAGGALKTITDGANDFLKGVLNSVSFGLDSVVQTLTGGGFIDLPDKWDNSDTSFPDITYKMELRSSAGDVISQLQNIYIPIAMILAGVLPVATGKASYTSPMLCSLFCKGVQKIDLGIIKNVSITRGTGNLGFNRQWKALAVDVSFVVKDLSSIMASPVNGTIFDIFKVGLDDTSVLARYLATMASRDIYTDKYASQKIKLKASRLIMKGNQAISSSAWGLRTGESLNFVLGGAVAGHTLTLNNTNEF